MLSPPSENWDCGIRLPHLVSIANNIENIYTYVYIRVFHSHCVLVSAVIKCPNKTNWGTGESRQGSHGDRDLEESIITLQSRGAEGSEYLLAAQLPPFYTV